MMITDDNWFHLQCTLTTVLSAWQRQQYEVIASVSGKFSDLFGLTRTHVALFRLYSTKHARKDSSTQSVHSASSASELSL